jgi:hypothetical protein
LWKPETENKAVKKFQKNPAKHATEDQEEVPGKSFPLVSTSRDVFPNQTLDSPEPAQQALDTPNSERTDPSYPPRTPRSRRELQPTRTEPSVTRSRARITSQDSVHIVNNSDA